MKTELIRKDDALHAVLHNQGDAAVADEAIEYIKGLWNRRANDEADC